MPQFFVTWTGTVDADNAQAAANKVENAIASLPDFVDLNDCEAEPVDLDDLTDLD